MSEVAATPEAAPVAAEPVAVPPSAPVQAEPSVAEVRQGLRSARESMQSVAEARQALRNEKGQFVSPAQADADPAEATAEPEVAPPEVSPEPSEGVEANVTPAEPDDVGEIVATEGEPGLPDGYTMLDVPEHHWARDKGITQIPVLESHADTIKGILNDPVRRAEINDAQSRVYALESQLRDVFTEVAFYREKAASFLGNPQLAEQIAAAKEAWGDEAAQRLVDGYMSKDQEALHAAKEQARQAQMQAESQRVANRFVGKAHEVMAVRYPLLSVGERENLLKGFASAVRGGVYDDLTPDHLFRYGDGIYNADPRVTAARAEKNRLASEAEQRAAAKLRADEAARQRDIETQRARNPLGRAPAGIAGGNATAPAQEMSVQEVRRQLRHRTRG
jgi:hypothetical protein